MIFYNFESYFGKPKRRDEVEEPVAAFEVAFDNQKWQWLMMVEKLCKELNYKPEEVYELNYISCLNWLSMFHLRDKRDSDRVRNKN